MATLDDSMNRMSAMDSGIHAYSKGKLAGPAFTIKVPYGDNLMLHKSVDMIKPGDILVIQCENSLNRAIFGSLLVNNLKEKGARGIIVDGAIRDSEEISQIEGIPVYARCTSPNGPWKNGPGEINTTIAVGGQIVRPGDIVCADQDGIVVVPQEYAEEIAAETKEKEEGETKESMSPQDKVERVLKEIHVTFSRSEMMDGHPDKVIIDRKKFLGLLDRLNQGIYDMMDQYEQTRQSRNNAERAFRKKGDEIIEAANANAEDVYAASVIYTADMIGAIRDLMDQTNDSMNDLFMQFKKDLREQKDKLQSHENELQGQLADLADTKKYLSVIDDINRQRARKNRDLEAEKEAGVQYARNMMYIPPSEPDIKVNEQYFENSGTKRPEDILSDGAPAEKPDIKINTDAAYFKWKASQEAQQAEPETETQEHPNPEFPDEASIRRAVLEDEFAQEQEQHPHRKKEKRDASSILKDLIFGKEE